MTEIHINSHEIKTSENEAEFEEFSVFFNRRINNTDELRELILQTLEKQQNEIKSAIRENPSPLYATIQQDWQNRCLSLNVLQQFKNDLDEVYLFFSRSNFIAIFLCSYPTTITLVKNIFSEDNDFTFLKNNFYDVVKILFNKNLKLFNQIIHAFNAIDRLIIQNTLKTAGNFCNWPLLMHLCKTVEFDADALRNILRIAEAGKQTDLIKLLESKLAHRFLARLFAVKEIKETPEKLESSVNQSSHFTD